MKKSLKIFLCCLSVLVVTYLVICFVPGKKVTDNNPFIANEEEKVLIAAHRGGKNLNPENTFMAFDYAIEHFDIDILELDLCITKDGYLVSNHNMTINSSTDVTEDNYYIYDHYLAELQKFNFGHKFETQDKQRPYEDIFTKNNVSEENKSEFLKEQKLRIATIDEIFTAYKDSDLKFILEIKNKGELGTTAANTLCDKIREFGLVNRVVVGTFHPEVEKHLTEYHPDILRGASMSSAAGFVVTTMLGVNSLYSTSVTALQIPTDYEVIDDVFTLRLNKKSYIRKAHKRNISVQYWTINDVDEMRELIDLGADVIMTDSPDILYNLLKDEYYCR